MIWLDTDFEMNQLIFSTICFSAVGVVVNNVCSVFDYSELIYGNWFFANALKWHSDVNEIRMGILGSLVICSSFGLHAFPYILQSLDQS